MDDETITALARGMAPFARDLVTEAVAPLIARVAAIEARPTEKGEPGPQGLDGQPGPEGPQGPKGDPAEFGSAMLPLEIAEQVAAAARMLHELPPVAVRGDAPAKVTRIERDESGAFVPVYDEPPAL